MNRQTSLIAGGVTSFILVLIFVWMFWASGAEVVPVTTSEILDAGALEDSLSAVIKKEKNGDLPVNLKSEELERDNPFGGL